MEYEYSLIYYINLFRGRPFEKTDRRGISPKGFVGEGIDLVNGYAHSSTQLSGRMSESTCIPDVMVLKLL